MPSDRETELTYFLHVDGDWIHCYDERAITSHYDEAISRARLECGEEEVYDSYADEIFLIEIPEQEGHPIYGGGLSNAKVIRQSVYEGAGLRLKEVTPRLVRFS